MKKALLQIHLAVLLWGFTGVLGRAITLDAPVLVWYRMLLTAFFMSVILTYRRQWVPIKKKDMHQLTLVGCLMGIHWVAFYGSIKLANASIALVCLSTASIFTTLIDARMHKRKADYNELMIGALALLGVFLMYLIPELQKAVSGQEYTDPLPNRNLGIAAGITAAFLSSAFTVLNKQIAYKYPARTMVFYEMGAGWLLITLLLPLHFIFTTGVNMLPQQLSLSALWECFQQLSAGISVTIHPNDWFYLIILALCCTVWAQSLALNALKQISSFTATLSVNLEPLYGVILAFIFFKENQELNWGFYLGMLLILLSVLLQMLRLLKPAKGSPGYIKEKGGID